MACLLLAGVIFFSLSGICYAVDVVRLDKTKIRMNIAPGQKQAGEIIAENPTADPKTVRIYLEDWYYLAPFDGTKDFKPANTTKLSCANWINFSPAELTLAPYAKQKINYTVSVPAQAAGGHYAVLFVESLLGKPESEGVGVSLAVRIAALFYIEAQGTIKNDVLVENLSLERKSKSNPLNIGLELKNLGNVDVTCGGNFNIIDKDGMVYGRGDFNTLYTFPGDTAKLLASWNSDIPKGVYDLIITLDLGKAQEETGIGRGDILVKEAAIEIGENAEVIKVGELK
jgi:hypothetical protein